MMWHSKQIFRLDFAIRNPFEFILVIELKQIHVCMGQSFSLDSFPLLLKALFFTVFYLF